jgi:hypothetical protein
MAHSAGLSIYDTNLSDEMAAALVTSSHAYGLWASRFMAAACPFLNVRRGRGLGSAGDNPPSEGEQLKMPSFLISNPEFKSLGRWISQFGHLCSLSANVLGAHVRHWWQN